MDIQTVAARSGASVAEISDYVEDGLMPGPVRLTGDGVGSGARAWYKHHIDYAMRIAAIRHAKGSRALAALKLLVDKYPPPSAAWVRRAVREAFLRYAGGDVTVGQIRKATQQQWDEGRIRQQMRRFPTLSEQDARTLTYEARAFSPTRNPADGMERAKEMHKTGARLVMNKRLPEDAAYGDISAMRVLDVIDHAPDEAIWRVLRIAQSCLIRYDKELSELLHAVPFYKGRSNDEIVEAVLHYPGVFHGTRPVAALLPSFIIGLLLEPSANDLWMLATLLGIVDQLRQLPEPDWLPPDALIVDSTVEGSISPH